MLKVLSFFFLFFKHFDLSFFFFNNQLFSAIKKEKLLIFLQFINKHVYLKVIECTDIVVLDHLEKKKAFIVIYQFKSLRFNSRLSVCTKLNRLECLPSIIKMFGGANWLEREVFDMFGIFFYNHFDLRRILTDYGFMGHPLLKSFPVVGYKELWFSEKVGRIVYTPVSFTQEFRVFKFSQTWKK